MFLDPEPSRASSRGNATVSTGLAPMYRNTRGNRDSTSGFFSSQRPVAASRDHRTTIRRKAPLQERTPSENNQNWLSPDQTTVRLVKQSSSPSGSTKTVRNVVDDAQGTDIEKENRQESPSTLVKQAKQGSAASSQDISVSGSDLPTNQRSSLARSDKNSLQSTTPIHAQYATPAGYLAGSRSDWQSWREWSRLSSTGNSSTLSTLLREGDSVFSKSERFSEGESGFTDLSTLRTVTPHEQEYQAHIKDEDIASEVRQSSEIESVTEASPGPSTVRVVSQAEAEGSPELPPLRSTPSQSSIVVRPQTSPQSASDSDQTPPVPRRSSRRSSSTSSLPAPLNIRKASTSPTPRNHRSQESLASSETTIPTASSPNFVAYGSDSPRPRSSSQPLAHSFSIESIQSRLHNSTVVRPDTGRSLGAGSSWSSLLPGSSTDTLAPLQVPKKRLRHKPAHLSLNQAARATSSNTMADEDIDTLPYPREQFSSHLSTIASESDWQSRVGSQRLSHFSLGSGVLTGDDASSILPFSSSERRRRTSAPIESIISSSSPIRAGTSSEEEAGDMTLGVFREQSAKPQPLFKQQTQNSPASVDKKYDGPLPPIPPIPSDSDENVDRVSGLPSPSLRPKRSGYSLRRRSHSTPSRRISESDRWSHASSIFPVWAKHFYGHGAALMSASKISLSAPGPSRGRDQGHERNASQWTERSITSRLGTGYSEIEGPESPTSSHFLPSIFRPRTRGRANTDGGSRKLQKKSHNKRHGPPNVADENRPDSMGIFRDPLPESRQGDDTLPSGQPKWGVLKDDSERQRQRPLPRKYSKQRRWNEMEFPRPMTKDRLSDFHIQDPHLAPTTRSSYRMSMWRAPSFVESLDTLWRSRCNRQILLFALGFLFPPFWLLGAILPIPQKPMSAKEYEVEKGKFGEGQSEEDIQAAMMKHEAGDAEKRWREEKAWHKGRWWRWLNRIMSVIGVLVIAGVVSLKLLRYTRSLLTTFFADCFGHRSHHLIKSTFYDSHSIYDTAVDFLVPFTAFWKRHQNIPSISAFLRGIYTEQEFSGKVDLGSNPN